MFVRAASTTENAAITPMPTAALRRRLLPDTGIGSSEPHISDTKETAGFRGGCERTDATEGENEEAPMSAYC